MAMDAGDHDRPTPEEPVVHDKHLGAGRLRTLKGRLARVHGEGNMSDLLSSFHLQSVAGTPPALISSSSTGTMTSASTCKSSR